GLPHALIAFRRSVDESKIDSAQKQRRGPSRVTRQCRRRRRTNDRGRSTMDVRSKLSRRSMMKWGLLSAGAATLSRALGQAALADGLGPGDRLLVAGGRDESSLFPGPDMPGGAQTEIRMVQSVHTEDPDELEVAR